MSKIVKYNLEIMSCIFAMIIVFGVMNWEVLSLLQQMIWPDICLDAFIVESID